MVICMYGWPERWYQGCHVCKAANDITVRIFTFHIHLHSSSRYRLRPRKSSGNYHTTLTFPYQLPTKTEVFIRTTLLFMTSNMIKRPTDASIYCYLSTWRRWVSASIREHAPGITAQLVDPCRSSLLEGSHHNTLYGGESTRWIIQSYRRRWSSCQMNFFFPHNKKANTDIFARDVTIELISGKDVEIQLKHLGRTYGSCEEWQISFVSPGQPRLETSFPGGHSPTPRICIPSRIKICTDAATVKKPKIPSSCRTLISLRPNMPLFELAVIDYSYSGRRDCRN